jgi:hypothetical protein
MAPGATKRGFVCKCMEEAKMALSWIVNARQDPCHHCRPERSIDHEICLSTACHYAAVKRRRASLDECFRDLFGDLKSFSEGQWSAF